MKNLLDTMKLYDISMPITHDMPVYKGRDFKKPIITIDGDFNTGSSYETRLEMNLHTGTHLDTSLHMIAGGSTVESLDLEKVITNCKVVELTNVNNNISKEDLLDKDIKEGDFILLKTKNSYEDILEHNFIYLDKTGAKYLIDKKIKGVGIDGLGIERDQPEHETHIQLLEKGIVIIEGLRLKDIKEGEYILFAAPIMIPGAEAAPIRAILMK